MTEGNLAWYLGGEEAARRWVPGKIVAVERYTVGFDDETESVRNIVILGILSVVLLAPMLLWAKAGRLWLLVVIGLIAAIRRGLRAAFGEPIDVLAALNDEGVVVLLHATSGIGHGWRVEKVIGSWKAADVKAVVGHFYELDLRPPDADPIILKPTHPSPEAQAIAAAFSG